MQQQRLTKSDSPQAKSFLAASRVQLDSISSLFGLAPDKDEVADEWSARLERGEDVDLQAHLATIKASDKMRAHLERLSGKKGTHG